MLVVDVPDLRSAAVLDGGDPSRMSWFGTFWPTHHALIRSGRASTFGVTPPLSPVPEAALLFLPKARERARFLLSTLASTLPAGAPIWVVGAMKEGIESAERELVEVADADGHQVGKHARLLMGTLRAQTPFRLEDHLTRWELRIGSAAPRTIVSLPGVFSHGRLDDGTRLLLETVPSLPAPFLDTGCGAGVIGVHYAGPGVPPSRSAVFAEADALALESTRRTLELNGIDGEVVACDILPEAGEGEEAGDAPSARFASIVSNPPFHRGVGTDYGFTERLVEGAPARLLPGGTLILVCNAFLPVPALLDRVFGRHEVLADDTRFRVYRASAPPA
jgi:16S rRNA (guanine1207-N2)-methyltransferase